MNLESNLHGLFLLPGYMDGAVEAGERAAREVLHAINKLPKEEIYQEEPSSSDVPPVSFKFSFSGWNRIFETF